MAGFGGSVINMINSVRFNNSLKPKRKGFRYQKDRMHDTLTDSGELRFKKISTEELIVLKQDIRRKIKRRQRQLIAITLLSVMILTIPITYWTINAISNTNYQSPLAQNIVHRKQLRDYNFFLQDGNRYLEQHQYHNALFQYEKATSLFPNRFEGRLAHAQGWLKYCEHENTGCNDARQFIRKLRRDFPNQPEAVQLLYAYGVVMHQSPEARPS